jgi:hypothetical protein
MKRHLKTFFISVSIFSFAFATGAALAVSLPQGPALFETSLQSRISSTDTSMTLVANSVRGGGVLSGYNCFTVDEGRTDAEYICGMVSGTTVSSLERAVSPSNGTSTITSIAYPHRVGADVKVTDFPLIERLRNLLNAVEQFPNLLSYATTTACTGTSPNNTICDKGYFDGVVATGAPNANETTRGIVELGTQIEMASSTSLGSTLAGLVLQAKYATSSPGYAGLWAVITRNDGKISPNFFATTSAETYNFASFFNLTGTSTMATSTMASTSIKQLNVTNASTTNLTNTGIVTFPNGCTGCTITAPVSISTTFSATSAEGASGSATALCVSPKVVISGGYSGLPHGFTGGTNSYNAQIVEYNGPSGNGWRVDTYCSGYASNTCNTGTVTVYAICVNP